MLYYINTWFILLYSIINTVVYDNNCQNIQYDNFKILKYENPNEYKKSLKLFKQTTHFIQNIFSIKNEYSKNTKRKVIVLLGIKMKFKIKTKA